MGVSIKLVGFNADKTLKRLVDNDKVGLFMAETCARYMDKYIPMDTGMLSQNYEIKPFEVKYNQPYAHRMFYGTGLNFNKEKHPLATAHWDVVTQNAKSSQISKEVQSFIERG